MEAGKIERGWTGMIYLICKMNEAGTKVQVVDDTYLIASKANKNHIPTISINSSSLAPTLIIFYSFKIIIITSMNVLLGIL